MLSSAHRILETVMSRHGSESRFLDAVFGPVLPDAECLSAIGTFLADHGLAGEIQLRFNRCGAK
jgi:hypothetical protein